MISIPKSRPEVSIDHVRQSLITIADGFRNGYVSDRAAIACLITQLLALTDAIESLQATDDMHDG